MRIEHEPGASIFYFEGTEIYPTGRIYLKSKIWIHLFFIYKDINFYSSSKYYRLEVLAFFEDFPFCTLRASADYSPPQPLSSSSSSSIVLIISYDQPSLSSYNSYKHPSSRPKTSHLRPSKPQTPPTIKPPQPPQPLPTIKPLQHLPTIKPQPLPTIEPPRIRPTMEPSQTPPTV